VRPAGAGVKLTYDDFVLFPDDGKRHELIDGEHYVTPSPNVRHEQISGDLFGFLWSYLENHPIGRVFHGRSDVVLSNLDVVVPQGTFVGQVNLTTGDLSGTLTLPPATTTIKLFGLPIASATFAVQAAGPITGHVDLATQTVTVHTSFNFLIKKASATLLPWINLVGTTCRGAQPVTVDFTGPVSLTGASSFSATYTVPKFTGCGALVTPILNLIIPGPGNTFNATFAPPA
jgi:hypothetical protein